MFEIYDDVVPLETQLQIESEMTSAYFPWYLSGGTNHGTVSIEEARETLLLDVPGTREYVQFFHYFARSGKLTSTIANTSFNMFKEFCNAVGIKNEGTFRIKANLQTQCNFSKEEFFNTPHIDRLDDHTVAIYYVNDSDGDTVIFNSDMTIFKSITPKRGRMIVFNGKYYHAGRHPILSDKRIVINFNF